MSNNKDSLGDRMKEYEYVTRNYLTRKLPVIIRIDGKAFHSFTRGFKKPFDEIFVKSMQETTKYLCENVQGCVLGYTQSDEITLVLVDYQNREASAWFDNNIQKMVSVSASMATMAFNRFFVNNCHQWFEDNIDFDAKLFEDFTDELFIDNTKGFIWFSVIISTYLIKSFSLVSLLKNFSAISNP